MQTNTRQGTCRSQYQRLVLICGRVAKSDHSLQRQAQQLRQQDCRRLQQFGVLAQCSRFEMQHLFCIAQTQHDTITNYFQSRYFAGAIRIGQIDVMAGFGTQRQSQPMQQRRINRALRQNCQVKVRVAAGISVRTAAERIQHA